MVIALTDYQVFNQTVNMTIPTTSPSPPVLVQTVNGWIMIQQKLDSSPSFSRTWVEFQVNSTRHSKCTVVEHIHVVSGRNTKKLERIPRKGP